jgi:hypothetical protein
MDNYEPTDIFLWANNTEGVRDQLEVDLFLFNKNYTVYSVGHASELELPAKDLFLNDILKYVGLGAATGLAVRAFEDAEAEENVIQRTRIDFVQHASEVIYKIVNEEEELEAFSEQDHEFKRIKGIVARFKYPTIQKPFYVVKLIKQAQVVTGATSWMFAGSSFKSFTADAALKVAPDNQTIIIEDDIFVLNQAKFEQLFNYDVKKQSIAKKKIEEIEANFKLSFPENMDMNSLVKGKKSIINKLQKIEPSNIKQEALLDHAEEIGIELMTDDSGAIIIMDENDLKKFVNLLNDDYVESQLTGLKYEIRSKKVIEQKSS